MNKQSKSLKVLTDKGYIFGLGAFRRYKEITGEDISHFEESLKPEFITDDKGVLILDDSNKPIRVRDENVDFIEANCRWATMLKCANDVYVNINGGDKLSVDHYIVLLNEAEQSESDELLQKYLDSNYLGKPIREYYGIPAPTETKKKSTAQAKRTPKR